MAVTAVPGVVLAVWTSPSLAADLIRAGEALEGKPAVANHVVVVTHTDKLGRWIGIQGQPGGVGLCDCTEYLTDSRTRGNYAQPRPGGDVAMNSFLASCAKSLGVAYDWAGIAEDGLDALHLHDVSAKINELYAWPAQHGKLAGEVVCSSLAWELYEAVGWAVPDAADGRECEPADWWDWSDRQLWAAHP